MKKILTMRENGQALVLIAFAAIGLFAFAALAIDGSMVFSDRRHAQNAADTAALDAALAYIRDPNATNPGLAVWRAEGLERALSNGYNNDGTRNVVAVELCSLAADPCDSLPAGADPASFIQVQITSNVNTYFARVIGITQITNRVEAVAEVVASVYDEMFYGNAVVGLSPDDCKAVMYQGNADTTITGGGIYVNSSCPDSAFFNNSSAAQLTAPSLCAVGGIDYNPGAINIPSIQTGCKPPPSIVEPNIDCSSLGTATPTGNVLSPGNFTGTFPPAGVDTLESGIYCVDGNFRVNGGDSLQSLPGGVVIKMVDGDVRLEGNGSINLSAQSTGVHAGLLIYLPYNPGPSNCEEIIFNGTGDFLLHGTILAPCSDITVNGTGTGAPPTGGLFGQVIGYTVDVSGTSDVNLVYNDAENWDTLTHPQIKVSD